MNPIKNTAQQLVRRRLWPVAVLLVAALVAVPMTLAKSPAPAAPVAAVPAKPAADAGIAKPVVQLSETTTGDQRRRRVLGAAKDPFEPAPLPKVKKSKHAKKKATAATATPTPTPDATKAPSSSGGGASAPPSAAPTPAPTITVPKGSIKVRFHLSSEDPPALGSIIGHLDPLPSADAPVLVLESLKDNGKTAVFSIPGDVKAVGDGSCSPTPADCATLELKAGETEFITVGVVGDDGTTSDVEYELDLMKIYAKATAIPKTSVAPADGSAP
jgi:hypothetical protein